jgi:hypothetical protein
MSLPSHIEIYGHHGHQAPLEVGLDFINTLENERAGTVDHLPTAADALRWFRAHDLLHQQMLDDLLMKSNADPAFADLVLTRLRRVRGGLRELVDAKLEHRPADTAALRDVNRALRTQYVIELVPATDGITLDHRHEGDPVDGALARLSETIARELTQVNGRLRDVVVIPAGLSEIEVEQIALARDKVRAYASGAEIVRVVQVPGRLVNVVTRPRG